MTYLDEEANEEYLHQFETTDRKVMDMINQSILEGDELWKQYIAFPK